MMLMELSQEIDFGRLLRVSIQSRISLFQKTKKSETEVNIRPMISMVFDEAQYNKSNRECHASNLF